MITGTGRRLRVAHLDHSTEPGGAELALVRLLEHKDWDSVVILPRGRSLGVFSALVGGRTAVARCGPVQPAGASRPGSLRGVLVGGMRLAGAAVALVASGPFRAADVVHANSTRSAVYGAMASRLLRKRFVVQVRDTVDPDVMGRVGFAFYSRLVLPSADAVIANSRATLTTAAPYVRPDADVRVIPSPIGVMRVEEASMREGVRRVGMVARIAPWKGQDVLLRAFAEAFAGSEVQLRLIGGTSFDSAAYLHGLERLARELGIEQQVLFTGHRENVVEEIGELDICVHASTRAEPLGQNVLQYLALGKATIVADAGGPAEWVTDGINGLLSSPGDVAGLTSALRRLAGDPALRARLGIGALETPGLLDDAEISRRHGDAFRRVAARQHWRCGTTGSSG